MTDETSTGVGAPSLNQEAPSNPILAASKESLTELFMKDPQFYTEENMALIVEKLRAGRGTWLSEAKAKKSTSTKGPVLTQEQAKNLLNNLVIDI